MTFSDYTEKSVSDARVLVELDIGFFNLQWVNNGAGIWCVDALNIYSWVDSTLLEEGFSAQDFGHIGSVQRDGLLLSETTSIAALTDSTDSWYYDSDDRKLWVCLTEYDEPGIHELTLGVVYGYSFNEFTPPSVPVPYEGRLISVPSIQIARDNQYYGVLTYGGGAVDLNNADGEFDTFAEDNELYGNPVRIYIGYADLDYDGYEQIYTGVIESVDIGEDEATFAVADKRKQLTKESKSELSAQSPISAIKALLLEHYSIPYTADYFDLTAFAAAETASSDYTVAYDSSILDGDKAGKPLIDVLGDIAAAGFINFWITADGKYTASVVDHDATTSSVIIRADDIITKSRIIYDPSEIVSSVKVGYAPTWTTTQTVYSYLTDDDDEDSIYTLYKTYKEHGIDLPLTATAATPWASKFMDINGVLTGDMNITVPMIYYATGISDVVFVEIVRPNKSGMVGTTLSYITSKSWDLTGVPTLTFGIKFL